MANLTLLFTRLVLVKAKVTRYYNFFNYLSSRQAIPGSSIPSKNSSDAPPPVEIWLICFSKPILTIAEAESPPPIIDTASLSATAFATASVPLAKFANSNTPIGPFQITVLADLISSANSSIVLAPISIPI